MNELLSFRLFTGKPGESVGFRLSRVSSLACVYLRRGKVIKSFGRPFFASAACKSPGVSAGLTVSLTCAGISSFNFEPT